MKYKAIIFDLDGVICHTDKFHYLSWKKIADEIGIYFDMDMNNNIRGIGRMESLDFILSTSEKVFSDEEKEYYADKKNRIYQSHLSEMSPVDLDREIKETIDKIKDLGLKVAIGSSSRNAKIILSQLGLENYFDAVSDGTNISNTKPDPEVFLKASEYLGIEPSDCLVVEDSISGVLAAIAAEMDSAAIGDATKSNLATYNLKFFSDLLSIVY